MQRHRLRRPTRPRRPQADRPPHHPTPRRRLGQGALTTLAAARVLLPGGQWSGPATLTLAHGRIAAIEPGGPGATSITPGTLTPGLVDAHINGAFGTDFATASAPAWHHALAALAARGVTSILPTVITAPLDALIAALRQAPALQATPPAHQARVLGIHLEGPFLSPAHPGAHRPGWLQDPTQAAIEALLAAGPLRMLTLAPERPGALAAIRQLTAAGVVVSLGHSDADAPTTLQAIEAGATCVTHVFNAMRPLHHRAPALVGTALTHPALRLGLIADGLHVAPEICRLVFAAAPGRVVVVSDAVLVAGLPPGTTGTFGGAPVVLDPAGLARRPNGTSHGTISGAGILLDEAVRRLIAMGIPPAQALHAATQVPADALARPDLGRIEPGATADLVLWDEAWHPTRIWIAGQELTLQ